MLQIAIRPSLFLRTRPASLSRAQVSSWLALRAQAFSTPFLLTCSTCQHDPLCPGHGSSWSSIFHARAQQAVFSLFNWLFSRFPCTGPFPVITPRRPPFPAPCNKSPCSCYSTPSLFAKHDQLQQFHFCLVCFPHARPAANLDTPADSPSPNSARDNFARYLSRRCCCPCPFHALHSTPQL